MPISYLEWNDALSKHFFNPEMSDRPVYLYVTEELVKKIGLDLGGGDVDAFVAAVKEGAPWATREGLCQRALQTCKGWRDREEGLAFPPYIGYLSLFVLAAGVEGEFAPHAYYPRLRKLLGMEDGSMLPSFDHMLELWDDLERWTLDDHKGELGTYEAQIAGEWIHVGLILAQTILTEDELKILPRIFALASLDPSYPPSDHQLLRDLLIYGKQKPRLMARTIGRLKSPKDDPKRIELLLDAVEDQLRAWDGTVPESAGAGEGRVRGTLRLCLALDGVSRTAKVTLRCKVNNQEYPEEGLSLQGNELSDEAICLDYLEGWSSPLKDSVTGEAINASSLDWISGCNWNDSKQRWFFQLGKGLVRIFVDGGRDALPGLVEVGKLPRATPFHVLFHTTSWGKLEDWSKSHCRGFVKKSIQHGLPADWQLAKVEEATSDTGLKECMPSLAFNSRVRLQFRGGLRSYRGNHFFEFSPPELSLEGGRGDEELRCSGKALTAQGPGTVFSLPGNIVPDSGTSLEVYREGEPVRKKMVYLTGDFDWRHHPENGHSGRMGASCMLDSPEPRVSGAILSGFDTDVSDFHRTLNLEGIREKQQRVYLIGGIPGQVACWPSDSQPTRWEPIWAIPFTRTGKTVYCGTSLENSHPGPPPVDAGKLDPRWKKVLWQWRKRIEPPKDFEVLRDLWREFQRAAQEV